MLGGGAGARETKLSGIGRPTKPTRAARTKSWVMDLRQEFAEQYCFPNAAGARGFYEQELSARYQHRPVR